MKKPQFVAAGILAAAVILIATWKHGDAAIVAVGSAFALLGAILGIPGLGS